MNFLEKLTGLKNAAANWISAAAFALALVLTGIGFDKLLRYDNGDRYPYELHNAYVGGDAYNYIINGNYATAYFTLAMLCVIIGIGALVIAHLKRMGAPAEPAAPAQTEPVAPETSADAQ